MTHTWKRLSIAVIVSALALSACGIPVQDEPVPLPSAALPDSLFTPHP